MQDRDSGSAALALVEAKIHQLAQRLEISDAELARLVAFEGSASAAKQASTKVDTASSAIEVS